MLFQARHFGFDIVGLAIDDESGKLTSMHFRDLRRFIP